MRNGTVFAERFAARDFVLILWIYFIKGTVYIHLFTRYEHSSEPRCSPFIESRMMSLASHSSQSNQQNVKHKIRMKGHLS